MFPAGVDQIEPQAGEPARALAPAVDDVAVHDPPLWCSVAERVICAFRLAAVVPVILVLAALIRPESPGAPLFFQNRIAHGGRRPFRFVKLRTIYAACRGWFPAF